MVTGHSNCGKTSLAHWCAFHLDQLTNVAIGRSPGKFVLDLSGYRYLSSQSDEVGTVERATQICTQAIIALRDSREVALPSSWLTSSGQLADGFRKTYEQLAQRAAVVRFTPIVIIPSISSSVIDMDEYLYLATTHANVVFIAESSDDVVIKRAHRERDGQDRIVLLQLGLMSGSDGWFFVTELLGRCGMVPAARIRERDVIELMRLLKGITANSPRKLREVLYSAWERHENESPPGMVTADDLLVSSGQRPQRTRPWRKWQHEPDR
ncbi:MAG: hypothetical protein JXA67_17795 [Micromonosporaceae bacterium]|nr:hypothetical protein [Micromonosporaceae bacterium]